MDRQMTIGKLAKISGVSTRTIRHYEEIGLLECATKTDANYRLYGETEIRKLERILLFKSLGFSLDDIHTILGTEENQKVVELFDQRMEALERELAQINHYREMLQSISKIYQQHGLEYVSNYHLLREMVCMNNIFVKTFNQLDLNLQIKILMEIYRTGSLTPETLKEMGVEQGSQTLHELHMIIVKVLLNRVDSRVERDIILALEQSDPELAERVKKAMFIFEDIVILPDVTIEKWLEKCADQELEIALCESSKYVQSRILHTMPTERAQRIRKNIQESARPTLDEVYSAMTDLVDRLREMEATGEIKIARF